MLGLCRSVLGRAQPPSARQSGVFRLASSATSLNAHEAATLAPSSSSGQNPLLVQDYFGVQKLFTVQDLFEARAHLGHKASAMDARMRQFVFGTRFGQSIIDLDQTTLLLRQALNVTAHIAYRKGCLFSQFY
jgi:small subunit ribosomal protein S2